MGSLQMPLIALAAAYVIAMAAGPLLPLTTRFSRTSDILLIVPLLAVPLLVPVENIVGRAVVAFAGVDLALKLIDYAREMRLGRRWEWKEYLWLLPPLPILLVRLRDRRWLRESAPWQDALRALAAAAIVIAVFVSLGPVARVDAIQQHFLLDHAVKIAMFVVLIEAGSYLAQCVERLLGFDTARPMRDFYLSLTPAEFWSRYNTRIHSWLEANVYRPCGGGIRGVVAVFVFSAAFHELAFDIATSHPDGYQFTFFMLQAPAVIASPSLKRFAERYGAAGQALVRMLTIAWFFFTSIFFFRGVERVFPIVYASQPWLP
jgi:hypothetical protein